MFGGTHNVPWDVQSTSLETFVPPWTVRRQVWSDSLVANHSGISTDVLLFSDSNLSLTHHYRVHKRWLLCHRRWASLGMIQPLQLHPVQYRRVMLALLSGNRRRPDLPDVAVVGCGGQ